ncbi:MAG: CrcB family protein [Gammaproteobacteria bacterium]|nr:CrcB family protein [Gammaproteobacteria bacterium]
MQAMILSFLIVGFGGATGAMARFGITMATLRYSAVIPVGTLVSNVLGCFIMGVVVQMLARVTWFAEGGIVTDHNRLLFAVGFCGAFTTLSALVLEMSTMMQRNDVSLAFAYLVITLIGSFAAFHAGAVLLRLVSQAQGG